MSYREEKKTETVNIRVCDRCGCDTNRSSMNNYCCPACGCDVCYACSIRDYRSDNDFRRFCTKCWELGEKFRQDIEVIKAESDSGCERIEKLWHELCERPAPSNQHDYPSWGVIDADSEALGEFTP